MREARFPRMMWEQEPGGQCVVDVGVKSGRMKGGPKANIKTNNTQDDGV